MGKCGVGRPRNQVAAHQKGVEQTIIVQAITELEAEETDQQDTYGDSNQHIAITPYTESDDKHDEDQQYRPDEGVINNNVSSPEKHVATLLKPWVGVIK
ncbi:unnamed protein product [Lathyrus sativus]|nr:unnamed protein product [Lathyrus sativus]